MIAVIDGGQLCGSKKARKARRADIPSNAKKLALACRPRVRQSPALPKTAEFEMHKLCAACYHAKSFFGDYRRGAF